MSQTGSQVRDPKTGEWVPEVIENQLVENLIDGRTTYSRVRIDHAADLSVFYGYKAQDGVDEWAPYVCFHIAGDPAHEKLRPHEFRRAQTQIGNPISYLKLVYADLRTQYRITRNADGTALYMMENRLSQDGQSRVAKVWSVDTEAAVAKLFLRDTGPAPEWPHWSEWPT
jgi:hypothetical protein